MNIVYLFNNVGMKKKKRCHSCREIIVNMLSLSRGVHYHWQKFYSYLPSRSPFFLALPPFLSPSFSSFIHNRRDLLIQIKNFDCHPQYNYFNRCSTNWSRDVFTNKITLRFTMGSQLNKLVQTVITDKIAFRFIRTSWLSIKCLLLYNIKSMKCTSRLDLCHLITLSCSTPMNYFMLANQYQWDNQ